MSVGDRIAAIWGLIPAGGGLSVSKICLGKTMGAPKTISAADKPLSSVGAALSLMRTHRRWRGQSGARWARRTSFSCQ